MFSTYLLFLIPFLLIPIQSQLSTTCHPQCSWKCDDPRCDAICEPVCEPPKCHTSCQEPKNAVCDVKCEKPDCQIMCPDKACEAEDCPKCVTICKPPHCVTHCQVINFIIFNSSKNIFILPIFYIFSIFIIFLKSHQNLFVKLYVKNPIAIGNVISLNVLSQNVS